jgi:hypothetical protein
MKTLRIWIFVLVGSFLNSIPAHAGCTVYQHRDFSGAHFELGGGDSLQMGGPDIGSNFRTYYYRPKWNDQISSFKVTADCTITLWEHAGDRGGYGAKFVRSGRNVSYVGSNWDDQASAVDCTCRR